MIEEHISENFSINFPLWVTMLKNALSWGKIASCGILAIPLTFLGDTWIPFFINDMAQILDRILHKETLLFVNTKPIFLDSAQHFPSALLCISQVANYTQ